MTFTLTGTLFHQDNVTPVAKSGIKVKADPYPDASIKKYYTSGIIFSTNANGVFSQPLVTKPGLYYTIRSTAKHPVFHPIRFLAPADGTTVDITSLTAYDPTGDIPSVYADTIAARNAAIAAAAGVQTNNWAASTAYVTGQTVRAPDGSTIKRNSSGTSRATYDATEQALWTVVFALNGTQEKVAMATSITQPYFDAPTGGDDLSALTAAVNAMSTAGSGRLPLRPNATYLVSNSLVVPNKVRVIGAGRSSTFIKAHASFPATGAALVNLGPSSLSFGSRLEDCSLDCNNVALSIGVYSFQAQEMCGVERVAVSNFKDQGIHFDSGAANFTISDVECYPSSTGANYGIHLHNGGSQVINKATCGVQGLLTVGIYVNSGEATIIGAHLENTTDGVLFDNARGVVIGATGPTVTANVTNLIRMANNSRYVTIIDATKNSATNTFRDDFFNRTVTDSFVQLAVLGDQYVARLHHVGDTLGFFNTTPINKAAAITATPNAAPAGGTGTAAGGWDTAANRDLAIATINGLRTTVADMKARLVAYGLLP